MNASSAHRPGHAPTRARGLRRARPGHRARGRPGHRRPDRARPPDADRPARQQPRPARGRARARQDAARADDRRRDRLRLQPDPVHAGPDAGRHHRHEHPGRGGRPAGLPVPARAGLRQPGPGRRDQPGDAEDPVEPARGDAGAPGHGRPPALPARRAVLRAGDPEPARDGGHLSPPRGAARPLPVQGHGPLPVRGGPGRDHGPDDRHRGRDGEQGLHRPPRSSRCSGWPAPCRSPRT